MVELGRCQVQHIGLNTMRCLQFIVDMPLSEAFAARSLMDKCQGAEQDGREIEIVVRTVVKKRSLDQNAYMWLLLERLAVALRSTAEEIYEKMLDRYGLHVYINAPDGAEQTIFNTLKQAKMVKTVERSGEKSVIYKAIIGSSHYDTAQMTRLLDGVIDECKALGIQTEIDDGMELNGWKL